MATKKKFYAVAKGKKTGIFTDWNETKKQIDGYSGARYKGFATREEAQHWLKGDQPVSKTVKSVVHQTAGNPTESIVVYTDGGSRNTGNVNGGHVKKQDKAAWAYLIETDGQQYSDSKGEFGATNNRMEIMALIEALKWLETNLDSKAKIAIVADSQYVLNAIQKHWLAGWKRRGWKRGSGQPLANSELWRQLDQLLGHFPNLHYYWTKGHATNRGNVFVDTLLNQTMDQMSTKTTDVKKTAIRPTAPESAKRVYTKKDVVTEDHQKSVDALKKSLEKLEWYND
ncbi:ribonuclease H family protein [Pediococcus ethanolidurans]|uniref:ribonuclease H n=1 Tax=Pediococcus ethanolidurans TaxID=319653 RepID=A0A0R2K079_9LACO|nr:ribonuclease H family protein [Pediococcus ethanolidurans]KRN83010.1 RNase HI [Pediococcus ethanolidurans]GEN94162.1 ribonuclease H [Pediococcus ethanolidurans]SER07127.1 ribonuclease HI [Pediococcus ethanolidurans]